MIDKIREAVDSGDDGAAIECAVRLGMRLAMKCEGYDPHKAKRRLNLAMWGATEEFINRLARGIALGSEELIQDEEGSDNVDNG